MFCDSDYQLPASLSKLYERFVILCVRFNLPESQRVQFKSLQNIPCELAPVFRKLCELALKTLLDKKLVFYEEELKDLTIANTDQFDGFGMLYIEHVTDEFGDRVKSYSFIHRAVQELMAAKSLLDSNSVEDTINKHFHARSYLINVFPFIFGLMRKDILKSVILQLRQVFINTKKNPTVLNAILQCLFEAQDTSLCNEFGQVFKEQNYKVCFLPNSFLEYHYVFYFLFACNCSNLSVSFRVSQNFRDNHIEIMKKYFNGPLTEMVSLCCGIHLSLKGVETFSRVFSCQHNLVKLTLSCIYYFHEPGCIKILCDSICKHHLQLTTLTLPSAKLSEEDLESLGRVIETLESLESLNLCLISFQKGTSLKSSLTFCNALCNAKCLKKYAFGGCRFSKDDLDLFSNIVSKSSSLKNLNARDVSDVNVITSILQGLYSNQSITSLKTWPGPFGTSHKLGQDLGKCLAVNQTLTIIDFTSFPHQNPIEYVQWSSEHVCCICTGLQSNNSLVTLDISGCYIDKTASDAVCVMLSVNTSLKHLFLNPVHLEKLEAIAIFNSCVSNTTLELLTLFWLPGRKSSISPWSLVHQSDMDMQSKTIPFWGPQKEFLFTKDKEIGVLLDCVQRCRQEKKQPSLSILWYAVNVI